MTMPSGRIIFRSVVVISLLALVFFLGRPVYWKISAAITDMKEKTGAPVVESIANVEGGDVVKTEEVPAADGLEKETPSEETTSTAEDEKPQGGEDAGQKAEDSSASDENAAAEGAGEAIEGREGGEENSETTGGENSSTDASDSEATTGAE